MHQMGFAQSHAAIQEQRIEAGARWLFGNAAGAGEGEFVWFADNKTIKCEARVQRRGTAHRLRIRFGGVLRAAARAARSHRRAPGGSARLSASPGRPWPTRISTRRMRRVFQSATAADFLAIMAAHPVAQETRRQMHGHFLAVDAGERHLLEPGAVFDIADIGLQAAADAGPLCRHLFGPGGTARGAGHVRFVPDAARAQETHPHQLSSKPPPTRHDLTFGGCT